MVYHKLERLALALDTNFASFPPVVDEGDNGMQDAISESEKKLKSIDLKVTAAQRTLNAIYNAKVGAHPSVLRHHRRFILGSVASRLSKSQQNLDAEMSETQLLLDRLIEERHRLQIDLLSQKSALARRNAFNSSMGNLPVELWAQIFRLCLPEQDFIIPNPRQAPLLLCQVCSSWRALATNTPLLWSSLSIRQSSRRYIWKSSLESWLTRSGNAFLHLDISTPVYFETNFDDHIFKLIVSSADRWHHLHLDVTNQFLRSVLNRCMPKLHTLEFSSAYPITSLVIPTAHVPSLKVVSFLTKPLYIQPVALPWSQLTSLSSLCWLNVEQHIDILRKCPNLEMYRMSLIYADIPPNHSSPLLMEHLKVLEIVAFIGSAMGPILSGLQLPSLTELSFVVPIESPACGMTSWPKAQVASLIERSSSPLTKLCLQGIDMSDDDLVDTEKSMPTLKFIEFF